MIRLSQILAKLNSIYSGCNCNGNKVVNDPSNQDYSTCQKKCKETNNCDYFGVWKSGHCIGWDACDSCQSSGLKNEIYKLDSGKKSY